jgi:NitT/TauT family transport system ATP-binding protein
MSAGRALHLRGVQKTYVSGDRTVDALAPTDLDVEPGEFVCLLGASGCGKSTLLQLVAGLEPATSGTLTVDDTPVAGPSSDRVLLFQDAALFPWLTVEENVAFGLKHSTRPVDDQRQVARDWLARVHLRGFEGSYVHQLSGGMRQRVALARALATDPSMLLMDEPFGALDALTRDRLHEELESLWAATRKTVLFVTHNVREAVALGDRVLVFSPRPGRIVADVRVTLPRPRALEDVAVMQQAADLMKVLRRALDATTDDSLIEA